MVEKWEAIRGEEIQMLEQQAQDDPQAAERLEMIQQEDDWRGYKLPKNEHDSCLFTRTQLL
jgi:hypothetical protein